MLVTVNKWSNVSWYRDWLRGMCHLRCITWRCMHVEIPQYLILIGVPFSTLVIIIPTFVNRNPALLSYIWPGHTAWCFLCLLVYETLLAAGVCPHPLGMLTGNVRWLPSAACAATPSFDVWSSGLFCGQLGGLELVTRLSLRSVTFCGQFSLWPENFSLLVLLAYTAHQGLCNYVLYINLLLTLTLTMSCQCYSRTREHLWNAPQSISNTRRSFFAEFFAK